MEEEESTAKATPADFCGYSRKQVKSIYASMDNILLHTLMESLVKTTANLHLYKHWFTLNTVVRKILSQELDHELDEKLDEGPQP